MKYLLIVTLLVVIFSLADAMFHLAARRGNRDDNRVARALTVRIGVSFVLFLVAILGIALGLIDPRGGTS